MGLSHNDIRQAIHALGLSDQPICVHSSLRSFGTVEGGVDTVLDGLLAEDCTVLVPTFSNSSFAVAPPADPNLRPARNGLDAQRVWQRNISGQQIYTPATREISKGMGALPAAVVARPQRIRGNTHCADPACSRCNDAVQGGPLLKHV
jgi:aminoglycoside N3'-acetyltransferase